MFLLSFLLVFRFVFMHSVLQLTIHLVCIDLVCLGGVKCAARIACVLYRCVTFGRRMLCQYCISVVDLELGDKTTISCELFNQYAPH